MHRLSCSFAVLILVSVAQPVAPVLAGTAGRVREQDITKIYIRQLAIPAYTTYTVETDILSSGADTVIHIQGLDGSYIDGNDDCATRLPGCSGLRSFLVTGGWAEARTVLIIVRNRTTSTTQTATLRITPGGGQPASYAISFTGGFQRTFTQYRNGTHFLAVEEAGGVWDTIMLITSQDPGRGIKYDDDGGVGQMSWIHAPEACASQCKVIISPGVIHPAGKATFIWDEDIHDFDCDSDGMSAAMESAIGTHYCTADTDGDGISDGAEVGGVDDPQELLKMPLYGADPLVKDVFLEADWEQCVPPPNQPLLCGSPSNPDLWRVATATAVDIASRYAPDVKVHIDTGTPNSDPATRYTAGAWGGATRHTSRTGYRCGWLEPVRLGYFHGGRISTFGGGQSYRGDRCFDGGSVADVITHEMGHNFNLTDAGLQSGLELDCKPNYRSVMNYAISSGRFSSNEFWFVSLNPSDVYESQGLHTTDPALIAHLKNGAFHYTVDDATGAVDWNRDGRISPTSVRAALTWGWAGAGCSTSRYRADEGVWRDRNYTAIARIPDYQNPADGAVYWFTRRESDGIIEYRYATSFPDNCGTPPPESCKMGWNPPLTQAASSLSGSAGAGAPAATRYVGTISYRLLLVYKGTDNRLRYQNYESGSWTASAYVPGTALTIDGDPAAASIYWNGASVFAISGGQLYQWTVDSSDQWTGPTLQQWEDATAVQARYGVGLTVGYVQSPLAGPMFVAAIPRPSPIGELDLAWKDTYTGRWTRLPDARWTAGKQVTQSQPGLAYLPFNKADNEWDGRYYLAWNPPDPPGGLSAARMTQSEGNNLSTVATSRRLQFQDGPIYFVNFWDNVKGNISLLHDLQLDKEIHLWGAQTFRKDAGAPTEYRNLWFMPSAHGIFNNLVKDQDDYAVLRSNLSASVHQTPFPM